MSHAVEIVEGADQNWYLQVVPSKNLYGTEGRLKTLFWVLVDSSIDFVNILLGSQAIAVHDSYVHLFKLNVSWHDLLEVLHTV